MLSTHTIQTDAANLFFSASDLSYLGWYRFNIPAAGAPPTTVNGTTDETSLFDTYPAHVIATSYVYNSTNQVSSQQSPDGGSNSYWYDLLSRLVFSQNSKQSAGSNWSYTTYDLLGRISEVGQKQNPTGTLGNPDYLQNTTINTFYGQGSNSQITHTYYDSPVPTVTGNTDGIATLPGQQNLRKRVAASTYTETQGSPALRATYYNYDIDGNVKTLWQQVDGLYQNSSNTGLKRIDYEYDLVSGKVNFVSYQNGQPDAFYYQYNYDADNRLTQAWSGTTAITDTLTHNTLLPNNKKRDAAYRYYLHGPLQRMELGDSSRQVQGVDYAYTLQGWLKGVNSTAVQSSMDMGRDSLPIPRDAYGYALYYYSNDYSPISGTNPFNTAPNTLGTFNALYNGNIAASSMNIAQLADPWHYYTYKYDQLNRIKATNVYKVGSSVTQVTDYNEAFTYDGNGNILSAIRNKGAAAAMDSLTYNYNHSGGRLTSNRLNYVSNKVTANNYPYGVAGQSLNNYTYDAIGNMTADVRDTISAVNWTVYGKIQNLTNAKGVIAYTYDPAGQRVSQTANGVTTWYIRDAQGNALALYDNKQSSINWKEQELYGSSRLGLWQPRMNLTTGNETASWDTTGKKNFELSNHLGNVLATLTENRIQHSTNGTSIDYFNVDINTANEYYAFGGLMAGRTFTQSNNYRYGFNGKENDNDVKGTGNQQDYGFRIYDPRLGKFLSVDPITSQYPELTPYQFASNRPIDGIDQDGLEFGKAPGMFVASAPGGFSSALSKTTQTDIRVENIPEYYKTVQVKDMDGFVKETKNLSIQLDRAGAPDKGTTNNGDEGKDGLVARGMDKIIEQFPQAKAMEEVKDQLTDYNKSIDLVSAAKSLRLLPKQFQNDQRFEADLINFTFDGSKAFGTGDKGKTYNVLISTLGKEIFNNREAILNNSYKRLPLSIQIIRPSWGLDAPSLVHPITKSNYGQDKIDKSCK